MFEMHLHDLLLIVLSPGFQAARPLLNIIPTPSLSLCLCVHMWIHLCSTLLLKTLPLNLEHTGLVRLAGQQVPVLGIQGTLLLCPHLYNGTRNCIQGLARWLRERALATNLGMKEPTSPSCPLTSAHHPSQDK